MSQTSPLPAAIDKLWEQRTELTPSDTKAREVVVGAVDAIDPLVLKGIYEFQNKIGILQGA